MGGAVARPKRRSANPRRHVPGPRALRSRWPRRARPIVTGGDPAAPGRLPCAPQPGAARPGQARPRGAGVGAPAPRQTEGRQRFAREDAGSGGPHGPPLRETVGSPFVSQGVWAAHGLTNGGKRPLGRAASHGRRRHRSTAGPVPRCRRRPLRRRSCARALATPFAALSARRVAPYRLRLAASVALLRRCTPTASRPGRWRGLLRSPSPSANQSPRLRAAP